MIISRAPLRVPLGGGGTDLASYYSRFGGFFLSAAINKYVFISINRPQADDLIRVKYSLSEEVTDVERIRHDLVRETLKLLDLRSNLEIASMADIPAGTGMGSSGSYTVALLLALHALKRDHVDRGALAEEACRVEIELAGHPVGKQDQYVASWGGLNCYKLDSSGVVSVEALKTPPYVLEDLERGFGLFYLGQTRNSATILQEQKDGTSLGDQTVISSLHRTRELGVEIKGALEKGDLVRFGELMDQHWRAKKQRSSRISNPAIDRAYDCARQHGAIGGKVLGAGGGGFLLVLSADDSVRPVREAMRAEGLRHVPFRFDLEGGKVLLDT